MRCNTVPLRENGKQQVFRADVFVAKLSHRSDALFESPLTFHGKRRLAVAGHACGILAMHVRDFPLNLVDVDTK